MNRTILAVACLVALLLGMLQAQNDASKPTGGEVVGKATPNRAEFSFPLKRRDRFANGGDGADVLIVERAVAQRMKPRPGAEGSEWILFVLHVDERSAPVGIDHCLVRVDGGKPLPLRTSIKLDPKHGPASVSFSIQRQPILSATKSFEVELSSSIKLRLDGGPLLALRALCDVKVTTGSSQ